MNNTFLYINAYLIASTLLLSVALKARDRAYVLVWLEGTLSKASAKFALATILATEALVILCDLYLGPTIGEVPLVIGLLLLIVSYLAGRLTNDRGACPCFGRLSLSMQFETTNVFALLFLLVTANYLLSYVTTLNATLCCLIFSLIAVALFFLGQKSVIALLSGTKIKHSLTIANHVGSGAESQEELTPIVYVFVSPKCGTCRRLLRYLEKFSVAFRDAVHFLIVIDNMSLTEDARLGQCTIVANSSELRREFSIDSTPTVVLKQNSRFTKYTGIQACNFAVSNFVVSAMAE